MLKSSCKKFFAGIAMVSIMGVMFPLSPTALAQTDVPTYYEKTTADRERDISLARDFANEYLKNSSEEPAWKGKKPYIASEKFFYTVNDAVPSYVEFKVSASDTADAGFIIVNLDAHDVRVPIASPAGKTPSEALESRFEKYHGSSDTEKLYYFSPFDQWMVDENGNAEAINPRYQETIMREEGKQVLDVNSEMILTEEGKRKQNIAFAQMKADAKNFVENSVQFRMYRMGVTPSSYVNPGMSNVLLPGGQSSHECIGATPCYRQFETAYPVCQPNSECASGCAPTAFAIMIGYHDRHNFPNLVNNIAPMSMTPVIYNLVNSLRNYMGTAQGELACGSTYNHKVELGVGYIRSRGYTNAKAKYTENSNTWSVSQAIKSEINKGNPIQLMTTTHSIVVWGYNSQQNKIVRMNMGWGNGWHQAGYSASNVDMHLDSIVYSNATGVIGTYPVVGYLTLSINGQ